MSEILFELKQVGNSVHKVSQLKLCTNVCVVVYDEHVSPWFNNWENGKVVIHVSDLNN